jgi:hypothetical protein
VLFFWLKIYFCSLSHGGFAARFCSCAKGWFFSALFTGHLLIFPLSNFWPPSRSDREHALAASRVPVKLGPYLARPSRFRRGTLFPLPVFSRRRSRVIPSLISLPSDLVLPQVPMPGLSISLWILAPCTCVELWRSNAQGFFFGHTISCCDFWC